jgi:hypothetical protein
MVLSLSAFPAARQWIHRSHHSALGLVERSGRSSVWTKKPSLPDTVQRMNIKLDDSITPSAGKFVENVEILFK